MSCSGRAIPSAFTHERRKSGSTARCSSIALDPAQQWRTDFELGFVPDIAARRPLMRSLTKQLLLAARHRRAGGRADDCHHWRASASGERAADRARYGADPRRPHRRGRRGCRRFQRRTTRRRDGQDRDTWPRQRRDAVVSSSTSVPSRNTRNVSARGRDGIAAAFTVWDGLNPASVLIPPARVGRNYDRGNRAARWTAVGPGGHAPSRRRDRRRDGDEVTRRHGWADRRAAGRSVRSRVVS